MSSAVKGGAGNGGRVSIPCSVKKTIQNIKEITGQNHSEDEIYAMLKECSMDPNETAQKLLLFDTFHEVKRKKDRRKENLKPAESKWKPDTQGLANRASRGNYPSRYLSHGPGRSLVVAKENVTNSLPDNGTNKAPLATAKEIENNGTSFVASSIAASVPSAPASGSYLSSSDPVLLPSQDLAHHSAVGPIHGEVENDRTPVKLIADSPTESKLPSSMNSTLEVVNSYLQPNVANHFHGVGKNQHVEPGSSTSGVSIVSSRPSSNHSNRSQVTGSQKVGPGKEWKPKSTNSTTNQDASELQKKLEESHISDKHVIIPNHLHVPEAEKLGFCFGSFDASFGELSQSGVQGNDKGQPMSQSSDAIREPVAEQHLSHQNALAAAENTETKYTDQPQSPIQEPEKNSSNEVEVSSSITPDYNESKQDVASEALQHHVIHTSSNYNFGFMPPTLNGQLTPLESSESQARDAPRFPVYIVSQSFDPASYYAQFYRPGMDADGRTSPFLSAEAANRFSGNAAVVSPQTSESPQEGSVPLVLSTATPTSLVTQSAGVMQSTLPTHQPLPVFRQPTGVHLPHHFAPNYISYGPYFSPYYIPHPSIHQFSSNGPFPQQPGNLYPTRTGTIAKFSVPQYKQGSNTGSELPGQYGNYVSSSATAVVTSTSNEDLAAPQLKENNVYASGQQTEGPGVWFTNPSRDIPFQQATSLYNLPPQAQLPFNPTYPGHGTFTGVFHMGPAPVHHPLFQQSQAITSPTDMAGPTASVYQQQQQQHAQMNWPTNY